MADSGTITITITRVGPAEVQAESNLPTPRPGAPLSPQAATALDLLQQVAKQPACRRVVYDASDVDPEAQGCIDLVRELLRPEGYGYSVTAEVRNAARRALGIKGCQEGLAA